MSLTGKNIIVTGASSGIGKSTAKQLALLGANVIMIARREEQLKKIKLQMQACSMEYYTFDLNDLTGIEKIVEDIVHNHGKIDGLVHCAGVVLLRPLKLMKTEVVAENMKVNYFAFVELIRNIAKRKNSNDGASLIGISSIASRKGDKAKISYCASKGAMDATIRCMAYELADRGIRVNSIMPGIVETEMYEGYAKDFEGSSYMKNKEERQYMGPVKPIEIANVAAFLLSDATQKITGTAILIDGGMLS